MNTINEWGSSVPDVEPQTISNSIPNSRHAQYEEAIEKGEFGLHDRSMENCIMSAKISQEDLENKLIKEEQNLLDEVEKEMKITFDDPQKSRATIKTHQEFFTI